MSNKEVFAKLEKIAKALQSYEVDVGILEANNARSSSTGNVGNAELGRMMEYGNPAKHIPARSFLKMPLTKEKQRIYQYVNKHLAQAIEEGQVEKFFKKLGVLGERIVGEAFKSGGYGKWAPNSPRTTRAKIKRGQNPTPLIDTGQLEKSISSRVKKLK